ncbi:MAG: M15 family metallopeptidase [Bacteroidetes bacterium]|nr:M15 family metallopeptidase [Bacteroidota bacterium]
MSSGGTLFGVGAVVMAIFAAMMLVSSTMLTDIAASRASLSQEVFPQMERENFTFGYSATERQLLAMGLVDIGRDFPEIEIELAYAKKDNIMNRTMYKDLRRAFLYPAIARKLALAQEHLFREDSSFHLVVLDAARPQSVQYEIWDWAIANDQQPYWAAPSKGSLHNYGCAVDVTIMSLDSLLDMGTGFDHLGPEAGTGQHWRLIRDGVLTQQQVDNRNLLKKVMRQSGFRAIQREWWHFNGVSNAFARENFEIVP